MYLRSIKNLRYETSLNDPVGTDKDNNELTLIELLSSYEENIGENIERQEEDSQLWSKLRALSEKERVIIILRYGLGDRKCRTQREIAKMMGISRSYVSRIEKKAVQKLRRELMKKL